jgi:hypothetical protein
MLGLYVAVVVCYSCCFWLWLEFGQQLPSGNSPVRWVVTGQGQAFRTHDMVCVQYTAISVYLCSRFKISQPQSNN